MPGIRGLPFMLITLVIVLFRITIVLIVIQRHLLLIIVDRRFSICARARATPSLSTSVLHLRFSGFLRPL